MIFFAKPNLSPTESTSSCAVVFCANKTLLPSAQLLDGLLDGTLSTLIKLGDIKDKAGESKWVNCGNSIPSKRVLLVNVGRQKTKNARGDTLKVMQSVAKQLSASAAKDAIVYIDSYLEESTPDYDWALTQLSKAVVTEAYRYSETISKKEPTVFSKLTLATQSKASAKSANTFLQTGAAIGEGVNLARQLGNLPGNICTPSYLAKLANKLAEQCPALTADSLGEKQMAKLGMNAFLSVSKGSDLGGKLIVMEYKGKPQETEGEEIKKSIVLVGKGITFDTGGISLKPGIGMDEMKFDMCGAASVFGTFKALIEMNAPVNVVGIVAAAENMPSGKASKPGDVVESMSGQTIEILNTDAEGRLVLCDALTYAERYNPKAVIDIATLTGACVIALGNHATGLYSNQQKLADALLASGENTNDRAWQMPLWDEYQKSLDSNFADMANIGGREAGSVTAACFLSRFAEKYPWAHLDIAGTAWHSGVKKGATGRPVSLLVDYILKAEA